MDIPTPTAPAPFVRTQELQDSLEVLQCAGIYAEFGTISMATTSKCLECKHHKQRMAQCELHMPIDRSEP